MEFLQGLRTRGYYDIALLYLDQLDERGDLPADIRSVLPLERAMTLKSSVSTYANVEAQQAALDKAAAQLQTFLKQSPQHPRAADANFELANILIGKAQVKIWDSQSPANKADPEPLRQEARKLVGEARTVYQKAHDDYKAQYDAFPKFIDPKEEEQLEARRLAETNYMRAALGLAQCSFEEAQTYAEDAAEHKTLLTKAAGEFAEIHKQFRSMVGGLYARMWQGKCFEQQGDIGKALGIYKELLEHGQDRRSETLKTLQDQVLQFQLVCFNDPARSDYQLVIDTASDWLGSSLNRSGTRTSTGLGIRWQKVLAHISLADKITKDQGAESDINRQLRLALNDAQVVAQYAGQYRDLAEYKVQELKARLGQKAGDPTSFDAAMGIARIQIKEIDKFQEAIEEAQSKKLPATEIQRREADLQGHLKRTADTLHKALQLAEPETPTKEVNKIRYFLAFVYYKLQRSLESAILSEFVATRYTEDDAQVAQDSAKVAMAAYHQFYLQQMTDNEDADVNFELGQILRVGTMIANTWPESGLANTSRMTVGKIYKTRNEPGKAAEWFSKVPKDASTYADAQIAAGQSYWEVYLRSLRLDDAEKPDQATFDKWRNSAKQHLQTGIGKVQADTPETADTGMLTDLIAAKVTLAQILLNEQAHAEALKALTSDPHPPIKAIQLPEGMEKRPDEGIRSVRFAQLVLQLLLQAHVQLQDIDSALQVMDQLEALSTEGEARDVTEIYVSLGRQIREELERQQQAGKSEVFNATLQSFDKFLEALLQKKAEMSYGSLQWMGETYLALAESLSDDARSTGYFQKAGECYEEILNRASNDAEKKSLVPAFRLRLAQVRRSSGEHEAAMTLIEKIIAEKPNVLDAQIAAAETLQHWGNHGTGDAYKRLIEAINGRDIGEQKGAVWGWGGLAKRLVNNLRRIQAEQQQVQTELDRIYAAEETTRLIADLETQLEDQKNAGAAPEVLDATQQQIALLKDAMAATEKWKTLQAAKTAAEQKLRSGDKEAAAELEELNKEINRLVLDHPESKRTFARFEELKQELEASQDEPVAAKRQALQSQLAQLRKAVLGPLAAADPESSQAGGGQDGKTGDSAPDAADSTGNPGATDDSPSTGPDFTERKAELLAKLQATEQQLAGPRERILDALYHVSEARHQYANQLSETKQKVRALRAAKLELSNVPRVIARASISDDWWSQFNGLYQTVHNDLKSVDDEMTPEERDATPEIPVPESLTSSMVWVEMPPKNLLTEVTRNENEQKKKDKEAEQAAEEPQGPSLVMIALGILVGLGVAGGVVFGMMKQQSKPASRRAYADEAPVFGASGAPIIGPPGTGGASAAAATRTTQRSKSASSGQSRRPAAKQPGTPSSGSAQQPRPTRKKSTGTAPSATGRPQPRPTKGAASKPSASPQAAPAPQPQKRQPPKPKPPTDG